MSLYHDHIFPRLLDLTSRHFDDQRRELMGHARGRVLELGVGTGSSLGFYSSEVTDVVGIDPFTSMLDRARRTADRLDSDGVPYRIHLHRASAEHLPYDDASFDTVVAFLTLCTIPDYEAAVHESYRVLRPGGHLLVMEHVLAQGGTALARWQRRLDPLWTRAAGGCHLDRQTGALLREAGFVGPLEHYRDDRMFPPTSPRIRGVLWKGDSRISSRPLP